VSADRFEEFDAAYVLGALSPSDRADFERHLDGCDACSARVAELSGLPALLGTLPEEAFAVADPPPPEGLLLSLQREVRRSRNHRRWYYAAGSLAAAAVLVLATALISNHTSSTAKPVATTHTAVAQPMTNVSAAPLQVDASLTSVAWGTRIDLRCTYDSSVTSASEYNYGLVVIDRSGTAHDAGSWMATPGRVTKWSSGTSINAADIAEIEVTTPGVTAPLLTLQH
jgi:hypothetical protein